MNFEFKPDSILLYSLLMIAVYSNAGISTKKSWFVKPIPTISVLMFYLLDGRNTKKPKTKMLIFYKQQLYFSQILSKKAKITLLFFMKNSNNNNIILDCSF